jgi:hypothetical protein
LIEVDGTAFLSLSQDFDLSIEIFYLLVLLFAERLEICIVDIKDFYRNDLVG